MTLSETTLYIKYIRLKEAGDLPHEYPYTVPTGSFFILGDYRTQSKDSRDFGAVDLADVKAKVITLLRRRSL